MRVTATRIIAPQCLVQTPDVMKAIAPKGSAVALIHDENTWQAAGEALSKLLQHHYKVQPILLERSVKPLLSTAEQIARQASSADVLVAVGSGTINDLTKYAAHQTARPYISVATAASMNGYSSASSSLEVEGVRQSFPAAAPAAVIADLAVIAAAPRRMLRAGFGDTLCRSTVEADMLLSHHVLGTSYPKPIFDRLRRHEPALIAGATAARDGDMGFLAILMEALLDAGDAMTEFGSSAVASQGEHMIAHTLELLYGAEIYDVLHGELVALTTLALSRLQHKMLLGVPQFRAQPRDDKLFIRTFGSKRAGALSEAYQKKCLDAEQANQISKKFESAWPEMKAQLLEISLAPKTLERVFMQIGLAVKPQQIGLDEERYRNACTYAYLTRDRFGFLDIAVMNDKRVV